MYIVIVGGGKVGAHLAVLLHRAGHESALVENRREQCAKLTAELHSKVICGDGCEPYVLDEAGVSKADAIVAVTGHDEDNLVVCLLGKYEYEVPMVIARINNPKNSWLFTKRFGVDFPVSNTEMIAKLLLEEVTLGEIVTLLKIKKGNMVLMELSIKAGAGVIGKALKDLELPADCVFVTIVRDEQLIIPKGETILEADDEVLALIGINKEQELARLLS